ncbi:Serine/threonine-protein kinase PknD [compost metagenome]
MTLDGAGNLYIAAYDSVWVLPRVTGALFGAARTAGTPSLIRSGFANLRGVALDGTGALLLTDTDAHKVHRLAGTTMTVFAGTGTKGFSGDDGPAPSAALDSPVGIAVDATGNAYIADTNNQRIRKVTP